ncbi:MAG: hypothetical protein ACLGIJ_03475 [Candidatus Limnocylindria bacterium]
MHRPLRLIVSALGALAILGGSWLAPGTPAPASAATLAATTTCSNGVDNTGGLGLICEVTITNTFTATGGSATVTVRECHGAAGDPEAACTTQTSVLTTPVTVVDQCNDATNGGGGTLRCSVDVTNDHVGTSPTITAASVNQCVGSGDGSTVGCDPFPATTTGATITQCNGSANGGTLVELTCIASGTQASGSLVTINQCNGSTNGGGGLVICSATITDNVIAAATPTPTPTATPTPTPTAGATTPAADATAGTATGVTPPPTDASPAAGAGESAPTSLAWMLLLLALITTGSAMAARRAGQRS